MKKAVLVVGVFISLFMTSCDKDTIETEIYETELQAAEKGDCEGPGSGEDPPIEQ